jgi:hypothetical protein
LLLRSQDQRNFGTSSAHGFLLIEEYAEAALFVSFISVTAH